MSKRNEKIQIKCSCGKTFKVDSCKTVRVTKKVGCFTKYTASAICVKCGNTAETVLGVTRPENYTSF